MATLFHLSPMWCNVVNGEERMPTKRLNPKKRNEGKTGRLVRASISFPPDVYETLDSIAKEKKVSLAWVVRQAVEKYVADKWPLFGSKQD